MSTSIKPIILYTHGTGPNPWKVQIILEELGIPFTQEWKEFPEMKQPAFEAVNPNGRVPAITDPNTGVSIWESGAIIEYLVEVYDKAGKLHYTSTPQRWFTQQFLHFQTSGQGPYFGQAAWFSLFHSEKIPSAVERYQAEIKRVTKVLDGVLAKNGSGASLVGEQVTYADLAFVPWYWLVGFIEKSGELEKGLHADNPHWSKWITALEARPAVKKTKEARQAKIAAQHS